MGKSDEYQPLDAPSRGVGRLRKFFFYAGSLVLLATTIFFTRPSSLIGFSATPTGIDEDWTSTGVGIALSNEYKPLSSIGWYPWGRIAEPFKSTTLTVLGTEDDSVEWEVRTAKDTEPFLSGAGKSIVVMFSLPAHVYSVTITSSEGVTTLPIMCKYVRREIRELTDEDRETFLDALEKVHRLDLEEGRALYGPKFTNYKEVTVKHLAKMTLDGCTPFHNMDVFLPAHEAFVLEVEQAMQAINASISLPFWDYSIDNKIYGSRWASQSPVFRHDWFGPLNTSSATDHVLEGRFAGIPVATDRSTPEHNGYGRVTDSVNANPSKLVTRAAEICGLPTTSRLPGCRELKVTMGASKLSDLRTFTEYFYHATTHMQFGGATDCGLSLKDKAEQYPQLTKFFEGVATDLNTIIRTMFTLGTSPTKQLLVFPQDCADDSAFADCAGRCPAVDKSIAEGTFTFEKAYMHLEETQILTMLYDTPQTTDYVEHYYDEASNRTHYRFKLVSVEENEDLMKWLVSFLCNPGKLGQFATPLAATNDPLFWPTHSAWGRFWAFVRIAPEYLESFDYKWDNSSSDDCENMFNYHDKLPFQKNFLNEGKFDKFYTNQELDLLFDPKNPDLPFVYETFEWDHCTDEIDAKDRWWEGTQPTKDPVWEP